ncbi:hypothetical protein CU098_012382, partial [Rhizopus stolonifer]
DKKFETLLTHLEKNQLVDYVKKLESGTFFAPDNDAFKQTNIDIDRSTLLYHIIKKGIKANVFYQGQLRETMLVRPGYLVPDNNSGAGQRIKFTIDGKQVFVNQAKIISSDIQVNNETYIQVVDRVLEPPSLLGNAITKESNQIVHKLLKSTDILHLLDQKKPFTVFLTTKTDPLDKFNSIESSYLTSEHGKVDLSLYFQYTIIDKAIFLDEFNSGKTTYKSLSGDSLVITSDKKSMAVNDIPIKQADIIAANGVIHLIEDSFRPPSIQFDTKKYLYGSNATHMVNLMDTYHLTDHYLNTTKHKFTFLVPPLNTVNQSTFSEPWLRYHIIRDAWPQESLEDALLLQSEFKSPELDGMRQKLPVSVDSHSTSIYFDHARAIGESINIQGNLIYQISDPLELPGDIFEKLVLDLDLSTFIATLYVSEVIEEIKSTHGLTLFVPTNEAFQNLGLVAKYLVHSTAKPQLKAVLRYHAVKSLLYYEDMKKRVHEINTLANATLRISQQDDKTVIVGRPDARERPAVLSHPNLLVSNGVVHKISEVQIPPHINITNQNLLVGIESKVMMQLLEKANLLDTIDQDNMVVLAPSDKAFSHLNLEELLKDQYQLERIVKLHIIPTAWQNRWIVQQNNKQDRRSEYATLLSEDDKVAIRENEKGELFAEVKNGGDNDRARVVGLGRVSSGGGVIEIDRVLLPIRRGLFGLPFVWSVVVTLTIVIIVGGVLSVVGFFGYKVYSRRKLGYRPIF